MLKNLKKNLIPHVSLILATLNFLASVTKKDIQKQYSERHSFYRVSKKVPLFDFMQIENNCICTIFFIFSESSERIF